MKFSLSNSLFIVSLTVSLLLTSCVSRKNLSDKELTLTCLELISSRENEPPIHQFEIHSAWIKNTTLFLSVNSTLKKLPKDLLSKFEMISSDHQMLISIGTNHENFSENKMIYHHLICVDLSYFEAMARAGGVSLQINNYPHMIEFALPLH